MIFQKLKSQWVAGQEEEQEASGDPENYQEAWVRAHVLFPMLPSKKKLYGNDVYECIHYVLSPLPYPTQSLNAGLVHLSWRQSVPSTGVEAHK